MGKTTDFFAPGKANIEQLRVILAEQLGADVTFEEAEEIGIQLISLYECLTRKHGNQGDSQNGHAA